MPQISNETILKDTALNVIQPGTEILVYKERTSLACLCTIDNGDDRYTADIAATALPDLLVISWLHMAGLGLWNWQSRHRSLPFDPTNPSLCQSLLAVGQLDNQMCAQAPTIY